MRVTVDSDVAPPDDIAALVACGFAAEGRWLRFHTEHAYAMVCLQPDPIASAVAGRPRDGFLLHWLQALVQGAGHGSSVMMAICQWADRRRMSGLLLCDERLAGWYQRFGWQQLGVPQPGFCSMARHPGALISHPRIVVVDC